MEKTHKNNYIETASELLENQAARFQQRRSVYSRLRHALGPILPGLCIDLLDLVTFLHIGVFTGMIAGGIAGYWAASEFGLSLKKRIIGSLIVGIYCSLPFTEFIPIGTIVGAYARFNEEPETFT